MLKKFMHSALSLTLTLAIVLATPLAAHADGSGKQPQAATLGVSRTVDANFNALFAIKNNGELWAVMADSEYMPTANSKSTKLMDDCISISTSEYDVFALKADGTVWLFQDTDSYQPHQILADLSGISFIYADYGSSRLYAVTEKGILFSYEWFSLEKPVVELLRDVQSVYGNGEMYAIKHDGSLWHWNDSLPTPKQIIEDSQKLIERKFTNPQGGFWGTNDENGNSSAMFGDPLYINENSTLIYDGSTHFEGTDEVFDGMGYAEVATDVAAFANTDYLVVLKKDGSVLSGTRVYMAELEGELEIVLTDVRLPNEISQNEPLKSTAVETVEFIENVNISVSQW